MDNDFQMQIYPIFQNVADFLSECNKCEVDFYPEQEQLASSPPKTILCYLMSGN